MHPITQPPRNDAGADPEFVNWIQFGYTQKVLAALRAEFDRDYLALLDIFPALSPQDITNKLTALKTKRTLILCLTKPMPLK